MVKFADESVCRRLSKGVEYLVEASAAEAEAISATLAAAKARQVNGEVELPDRGDRGAEATPSGKAIPTMIKPDSSSLNSTPPPGVRLHHRAVSTSFYLLICMLNLYTKHRRWVLDL